MYQQLQDRADDDYDKMNDHDTYDDANVWRSKMLSEFTMIRLVKIWQVLNDDNADRLEEVQHFLFYVIVSIPLHMTKWVYIYILLFYVFIFSYF